MRHLEINLKISMGHEFTGHKRSEPHERGNDVRTRAKFSKRQCVARSCALKANNCFFWSQEKFFNPLNTRSENRNRICLTFRFTTVHGVRMIKSQSTEPWWKNESSRKKVIPDPAFWDLIRNISTLRLRLKDSKTFQEILLIGLLEKKHSLYRCWNDTDIHRSKSMTNCGTHVRTKRSSFSRLKNKKKRMR